MSRLPDDVDPGDPRCRKNGLRFTDHLLPCPAYGWDFFTLLHRAGCVADTLKWVQSETPSPRHPNPAPSRRPWGPTETVISVG